MNRRILLAIVFSMFLMVPISKAQPGGGNFAQFRDQMNTKMKELMGSTDDEWKVIQPKIDAIQALQQESSTRRGMRILFGGPGGGGPGGGGQGGQGGNNGQPESASQTAFNDLQKTATNKDATAEEVKAKLTAYRTALTEAKAKLTKAQTELKELVSAKQEAILVMLGTLE